jgi:gamma-glutamyl hydrolase
MSAYVRYIEAAGARVIPLIRDDPDEVTLDKLSKIDGVLAPGGDGDYLKIGKLIMDQVIKYNDEGHFYPMWGTCLGYENMALFTASKPDSVLELYGTRHISQPLEFLKDPSSTKMFCSMEEEHVETLKNGNVTYNSHKWSIRPETMESDEGLKAFWDVTSISYDANNTKFIASVEAKNYPIMGTQFHPEKTTMSWNDETVYHFNHSWESIKTNRHFADLFVMMARANPNNWGTFQEVQANQIDNYELYVTELYEGDVYVFK